MEQQLPAPQRRTFLVVLLSAVGAVLAALAAWPIWQYLSPRKKAGEQEKVTVPRSDVAVGQAHFFKYHGQPAVILQLQPGQFTALSAVCTHLGCIVKWVADKQEFLCPCHGGRYSAEGKVLAGPPPKPLESLPVNLQGDQVFIG